ncbi:MAG: hypothetical protein J6A69_09800 [Clostridia bacterium]|nr:hypothetical protein [Clostridia bacterium]
MKNIFLIGDSIRFGAEPNSPGYGVYVKEKLEGKANVYQPDENCRFAQYTQRYIWEWTNSFKGEDIDVVHWNNGLWDVLRLKGEEPFTPVDMYVQVLERVYRMIKIFMPNAKIIFATSTAVVEEWADPQFMRYNKEIEEYNAAAVSLMESLGVEVNDLYSITKDFDNSLHSDWVHYGEAGSKILADKVVEKIEKYL